MIERKTRTIQHPDNSITVLGPQHRDLRALEEFSISLTPQELLDSLADSPLPFNEKLDVIVGWGGFSYAVRMNTDSDDLNGGNSVLVFRPFSHYENQSHLGEQWRREKVVNEQFREFTIPQDMFIVNDENGLPTAVKHAREIEGVTLNDMSPLAVLSNSKLLQQYSRFCMRAINVLISEGKLVDTSGNISLEKAKQALKGMIPFFSDNLLVEFGLNKLVFVDCDTKEHIHMLRHASAVQRVGLLMRAGAILGTALGAKAFVYAHGIRDKLFQEEHSGEKIDQIRSTESYKNFCKGIREITEALSALGVNYRVLGSVAMAGFIQSAGGEFYLSPDRINRTRRNINIIILDNDPNVIKNIRSFIRNTRKRTRIVNGYPDISLAIPINLASRKESRAHIHRIVLPTEFGRFGIDSNNDYYLTYAESAKLIDKRALEPVTVLYEGIPIQTVGPGVLIGFAITRSGNLRPKDLRKTEIFSSYTQPHIPSFFLDFAKEIRENYRDFYTNATLRECLYHWSGGFISGGQVSRFVDWFKKQEKLEETF